MKARHRLTTVLAAFLVAGCTVPGTTAADPRFSQPPYGGVQEAGLTGRIVLDAPPAGKTRPEACTVTFEPVVAFARPQTAANGAERPAGESYSRRFAGATWCASIRTGSAYALFWGPTTVYLTDFGTVRTSRAHLAPQPTASAFCLVVYYAPARGGELTPPIGPFPRPYCERVGPRYRLIPSAEAIPPTERK